MATVCGLTLGALGEFGGVSKRAGVGVAAFGDVDGLAARTG